MFSFIWPLALVILSNTVYQICAKSVSPGIHPLASLVITYVVGALASAVLYFVLAPAPDLLREFRQVNWASFVLGISIVGLEAGWLYAFQAGWQISVGFIVESAFLSIALLIIGYFLYHEPLTWNKIVGVIICLIGLGVIRYK